MSGNYTINLLIIFALLVGITPTNAEPLTIKEAVRLTLKTHPDVKVAAALIEEAKGVRMSELSLASPGVAIEYEGIPDGGGLSDYEEKRIAISQEFEFPLRYMWIAKAANLELKLAKLESKAILLDLEVNARDAYLDAWVQTSSAEILAEIYESAEGYADKIERQFELGETSRLDAKRARLEALEVKGMLKNAQRGKEAALFRLSSLTGLALGKLELNSPLDETPTDIDRISDLISSLRSTKVGNMDYPFQKSPETATLITELQLAGTAKTLSKTAWLPELELSYFQQTVPSDINPDFWGVELGFNLPLWFWWGGRGEIQAASSREKSVKEQILAHQVETLSEWQELAQNILSSVERYELYKIDLLPLSKEAYYLAKRSFDIGTADYFEVIDAQRSLLDVQLDFLETESEVYVNQIELDRLEGHSIIDSEDNSHSGTTGRKK